MYQKRTTMLTLLMALMLSCSTAFANENVPPEIVELAKTELVKLGTDPVIVAAVKAENDKGKSMEELMALGQKFLTVDDNDPFLDAYLKSELALYLAGLTESNPALEEAGEIYVLDNRGSLIATIKREEFFFFAEEEGFVDAMNGEVHIADLEEDEDMQEYMIHVFIPVRDGGTVIGAIDVGLGADDD